MIRRAIHAGGTDLSMDEMAQALGTSKSIIYRYFGDRAGLREAVGAQILEEFGTQLSEAAAQGATPRDQVARMVQLYLEMLDRSPNVYYFVTRPESEPTALPAFISKVTAMTASILFAPTSVTTYPDTTAGGPSSLEPRGQLWASAIVGFVRGAGEEWVNEGRQLPVTELAHALTRWIMAGLVEEPPAPHQEKS